MRHLWLLLLPPLAACGGDAELRTLSSPIEAVCTPQPASPDVGLLLEASTCEGCAGARVRCAARREADDTLVLEASHEVWLEENEACVLACRPTTTTCTIPPLRPGTYLLRTNEGLLFAQPEILIVGTSSGTASCQLPAAAGG